MLVSLLLALLIYPGLLLALLLAALFARVVEGRNVLLPPSGALFASAEGLTGTVSLLLAALACAMLPWPLHPAAGWAAVGSPTLVWAALEGAFLVPLLPGLLAPAPLISRAAMREAQMGLAGRLVIWFVVGVGLWSTGTWTSANALGHVCVLVAGALAFPAAAGVGPFGPERSLNRDGLEAGLDSATAGLLRLARAARAAVLLAALAVTGVPQAQTQPVVALVLVVALFLVAVLLLRRVVATLPRTTLLSGVRWSLARALPLAAIGLLVLGLVR